MADSRRANVATDAEVARFKRALAELLAEASERRAKLAGTGGKRGGQAA